MSKMDLSEMELRQALAAADRGMRLPYGLLVIGGAISAFATSVAFRFADWQDATHVLIVAAAVFLFAQMVVAISIVAARQNAANARMLRALELLEDRIGPR